MLVVASGYVLWALLTGAGGSMWTRVDHYATQRECQGQAQTDRAVLAERRKTDPALARIQSAEFACFSEGVDPNTARALPAATAGIDERLLTAAMAVVMLANPDDDLNISYYAHGAIDGLIKSGAYRCPKTPRANREQITAEAKRLAQQAVLAGKGDTPFGSLVVGALGTVAACSPAPPLK